MKTIKHNKLLASVFTSDILYFTSNINKKKNSNFFLDKIEIKKSTRYILLEVSSFLQSIKQIIRLLQYNVKYYKNFLQIITSSTLYNKIIEYISKNYGSSESKINAKLSFNNKLNSKVVAYIGNDVTQNANSLVDKTFSNNINSILLINSYFDKNILGNYKAFTDINNYKKLLFMVMVMLLSQRNKDKNSANTINYKRK